MSVFDSAGNAAPVVYNCNGSTVTMLYDSGGNNLQKSDLVIMSFNIQRWKGINADADIVDEILTKYNPDIVGLQEYDTAKTLGGIDVAEWLTNRFPYIEVGDTKITNYTKAVVSHHELQDATTVYYAVYSESRSYQKMYITFDGKRIAVFNTHFDVDAPEKTSQAKELFDALDNEDYFIVIGDFNTVCTSTADTDYIDMVKQFADAGYNLANCSEKFGFINTCTAGISITATDWRPRDHIITSANIDIEAVVADTTKIDANTGLTIDHIPLVAYLKVN